MTEIYKKLEDLGIELPPPPESVGLYTPAVISGKYLYLSGNGGPDPRKLPFYGHLGREVSIDQGRECARGAAIAVLSAAEKAAGSLDNIERIVKLLGFVSSTEDFFDHPKVIDGASELLIEVFGHERGIHARSAVGVASLPFNIPVEIEIIMELKKAER